MSAMRWAFTILSVCAGFLSTACSGSGQSPLDRDARPETAFVLLSLDKHGTLKDVELPNRDRTDLDRLVAEVKKAPPTHVFLLAHGWNNSKEEARDKYRRLLEQMANVADELDRKAVTSREPKFRSAGFRPLVIGLYWPSLAFEKTEDFIQGVTKELKLIKALPLRDLLKRKIDFDKVETVVKIVNRVREAELLPPEWLDRLPNIQPRDVAELAAFDVADVKNIADLLRVFSYWQMKNRAGTIGDGEVRRVLRQLQEAAPKAEFHLVGHSFGGKLWLAALAEEAPLPGKKPLTVDSLVLLQAAVSSLAFADEIKGIKRPGGYHAVRKRVNGPIIATFTKEDFPVGATYPLGSKAAGHVGELDVREKKLASEAYQGMGAHGIVGGERIRPAAPGKPFGFKKGGLYNFDANGTEAITGHSEFYTPEVAWLLWAAALRR